jgi:hypothetical protein
MMFPVAIALILIGYAMVYTGAANLINGGQGPKLLESLGLKEAIAPPGADKAILSGQPPQ